MKVLPLLTLISLLATGLSAGLFFAWTFSVIPGLIRVDDATYLRAMQSINRYIQNPWFFIAFMGPVILIPLTAFLTYRDGQAGTSAWMAGAAVIYLVGVFGVTMLSNVPMNNQLDQVELAESTSSALQEVRADYEKPWNRSNSIRTFASVLAFALLAFAFISPQLFQS